MLTQIKDEALVLQASDCKEDGRIVSLFTFQHGIIKIFINAKGKDSSRQRALSTPLTLLTVSCQINRGDLYRCLDAKIIDQHLELRKNLEVLESACHMARSTLRSQATHVAAPNLYLLLKSYLKLLSFSISPESILSSYQLKLLRHEGFLASLTSCPLCLKDQTIQIQSWASGEFYCREHSPSANIYFPIEEYTALYQLASSKSTNILKEMNAPERLRKKINGMFLEMTNSQ